MLGQVLSLPLVSTKAAVAMPIAVPIETFLFKLDGLDVFKDEGFVVTRQSNVIVKGLQFLTNKCYRLFVNKCENLPASKPEQNITALY